MSTKIKTALSKYIAQSGRCSRRQATDFIKRGKVRINGNVVTIPFTLVSDEDSITVEHRPIEPAKKIYLLLNKPKNVISTLSDEKDRKTVSDLLQPYFEERLYPVGRLDRATTGLLIMTNDGDLTQRLAHPKFEVRKVYQVTSSDFNITQKNIDQLLAGIELSDGFMKVDEAHYPTDSKRVLSITIHSGKNQIVRRLFKALGFDDIKLDRTNYAGLTKEHLAVGAWRHLTKQEVTNLYEVETKEILKKEKKPRNIKAKKYYARL
ncbi:rRNA pseudouridine synthase [Candidatus Babeliales bacterium]|nr:rRNA pseudouridine synthase [Candidatus Babeliales bacterium]MBP9843656.1 rRNA pseudouridine synthase [Candidatus Babeliales bacterium]